MEDVPARRVELHRVAVVAALVGVVLVVAGGQRPDAWTYVVGVVALTAAAVLALMARRRRRAVVGGGLVVATVLAVAAIVLPAWQAIRADEITTDGPARFLETFATDAVVRGDTVAVASPSDVTILAPQADPVVVDSTTQSWAATGGPTPFFVVARGAALALDEAGATRWGADPAPGRLVGADERGWTVWVGCQRPPRAAPTCELVGLDDTGRERWRHADPPELEHGLGSISAVYQPWWDDGSEDVRLWSVPDVVYSFAAPSGFADRDATLFALDFETGTWAPRAEADFAGTVGNALVVGRWVDTATCSWRYYEGATDTWLDLLDRGCTSPAGGLEFDPELGPVARYGEEEVASADDASHAPAGPFFHRTDRRVVVTVRPDPGLAPCATLRAFNVDTRTIPLPGCRAVVSVDGLGTYVLGQP